MAGCSNFAVEFNWNTNISQNVQNFGCYKKVHGFSKKSEFTLKWLKVAFLLWNATEIGSFLRLFTKFLLFRKKIKKLSEKVWIFLKWLKVSISLLNPTETVRFLKTFKICFFFKKNGVLERISWTFIKSIKIARLPQNRLNQLNFSTIWVL